LAIAQPGDRFQQGSVFLTATLRGIFRPAFFARAYGGLLALSLYHSRGLLISPPTPAQHFPFGGTGLLFFQPVALRTKPIDFVQHPI